jgi:uncharacterized RDD family membrane protein YckC
VIFIPLLVVLFILFRHTHSLQVHLMMKRHGTRTRRNISLWPIILTGIAYLAYATILCGGERGQTVGMRTVGVRVVRDGTMDVLGYGKAFVRAVVEQLFRLLGSAIIFLGIVWILDMLWPLWDKKRQTLHDKVVSTVVIRTRNPG